MEEQVVDSMDSELMVVIRIMNKIKKVLTTIVWKMCSEMLV